MHLSVRIALTPPYTFLAQLAEQRSFKPQVAGSSPAGRTICTNGETGIRVRLRIWCPSRACEFDSHFVHHIRENARVWSNGADCKSVAARLRWFKSNFSHHKEASDCNRMLFLYDRAFQGKGCLKRYLFIWSSGY